MRHDFALVYGLMCDRFMIGTCYHYGLTIGRRRVEARRVVYRHLTMSTGLPPLL